MKVENTQPYIIAYGPDQNKLQQYFIIVEQTPMNVSIPKIMYTINA